MRSIRWVLAGLVAAPFFATPTVIGADGAQDAPAPKPAEPAEKPAEAPGAADLGLLRNAADPSSAIEAYTRALAASPGSVSVKAAFVRRMVDFGLPEMADSQALDVVSKDTGNGLAWGVLAYMNAKRSRTADALADIVLATNRDARDPFILRTAGQLLAWFDTRAEKSEVPDDVKDSVEKMRANIVKRPACAEAYRRATDAYTAENDDKAGTGAQPPAAPPGPPTSLVHPVDPDDAAAPPPAQPPGDSVQLVAPVDEPPRDVVIVREPEVRYVYDTTYVYTDPYVYVSRPASVYCDPWWPTTWYGGYGCDNGWWGGCNSGWWGGWNSGWWGGCGSGWGASVLVGTGGWGIGFSWWGGGGDCDDDHHDGDHHHGGGDHHDNHNSSGGHHGNSSAARHSGDGGGKSASHGRGAGSSSSNGGFDAAGARRSGARGAFAQHSGDGVARADGASRAARPGSRVTNAPRTPRSPSSSRAASASGAAGRPSYHSGDGASASRNGFSRSYGGNARSYGGSARAYGGGTRSYTPSQGSFGGSSFAPSHRGDSSMSGGRAPSMSRSPSISRGSGSWSSGGGRSSGASVRSSGGGVRSSGGGSRGGGGGHSGARGR